MNRTSENVKMRWCPDCRKQVDSEETRCPDCGADLLDRIPAEGELLTDVEWVILAEKIGPVMTGLAKQRLESVGIPAIVKGGAIDTVVQYAGFDERIFVPQSHYVEARALLDDMMKESEAEPVCGNCGGAVSFEDRVCPHCGEVFAEDEPLV
jgi:predicted amidophosphoribosyltransferase